MREKNRAIVCPSCGRLIEITDPRCPHCGHAQPGLWGFGPIISRYIGQLEPIRLIVVSCIVLYLVALALDIRGALEPRGMLGLLSPSGRALYTLGMTGGWAWQMNHWWTVASAIYLHGGLLHIFFNVMWIRNLGPAVQDIYGTSRAFLIFQLSGIGGFVVSNLFQAVPTIGASGSIFGLLAALIVHGRQSGRSFLTRQVLIWAGILFLFGFMMPGVNNFAHGGGFVAGWVVAWAVGAGIRRTEETPRIQALALLLGLFSLVAVVLSVVTTFGAAFLDA